MLEVGNGDLTFAETRTHFALWAAMKSPLLIGTDLAKLSQNNVAILKNKVLLAFNQDDVFGKPAMPYKWGTNPDYTWNATYPAEFWSGQSKQGTLILAINNTPNQTNKLVDFSEVPGLSGDKAYHVTEGWNGASWGCVKGGLSAQLNAHDTAVMTVGQECTPKLSSKRNTIFTVR
jgi:alpha-galactosidase